MKISTKGRYGLMLLVDLAANGSSAPVSLKSIADRLELSEHYLEQLIAPLRNAGLVRSIRGAYGGYVLNKNKSEITVKDIILTLEGPVEIVDSDLVDGFDVLWERLRTAVLGVMESLTLNDLIQMRAGAQQGDMFYI